MSAQNFILQSSLAKIEPKPEQAEPKRVIMADISVFHPSADNREHFAPPAVDEAEKEYQAGFEAGQAEANRIYQSTIQLMEQTLEALKTDFSQRLDAIEASHGRVIVKCLEAVLPDTAHQVLVAKMTKVIEQAAKGEITGALTAHLHPDNKAALGFLEKTRHVSVNIQHNDKMGAGEVSFTWEKSEVLIDPLSEARRCLDLLVSHLGVPPLVDTQAEAPNEISHTSENKEPL
jgi:flagellar biosynthesis/type III secretory pathway protein FliH